MSQKTLDVSETLLVSIDTRRMQQPNINLRYFGAMEHTDKINSISGDKSRSFIIDST